MPRGERKSAPPVAVEDALRDDRAAMIAKLDADNDGFVHSFCRAGTSPDELRRKGAEVVREDGKDVMHEADIVIRVPKEIYDRRKRQEAAESIRMSSKIARTPEEIMQYRQPKKVRIKQENEE